MPEDRKGHKKEGTSKEHAKQLAAAVKDAIGNALSPVVAKQSLFGGDYQDPTLEWMRGTFLWDLSVVYSDIDKVALDKKGKLAAALKGIEAAYERDIKEETLFLGEECTEAEWQEVLRILAIRLEFIEDMKQSLAWRFGFYAKKGYLPYVDSDYWKRRGLGWMQGSIFEDIKNALDKKLYRAVSVKTVKPDAAVWSGIGRLENLEKAVIFVHGVYQREADRLREQNIFGIAQSEKIDILESRAYLANRYLWTLLKEAVAPMSEVRTVTIAGDVIYVSMEEWPVATRKGYQ